MSEHIESIFLAAGDRLEDPLVAHRAVPAVDRGAR